MNRTNVYSVLTGLSLLLLVGSPSLSGKPNSATRNVKSRISVHEVPAGQIPLRWYQTGVKLGAKAMLTPAQTEEVLNLLWNNTVDQSPDFMLLLVAVSYTESHMRLDRTSEKGAQGIMQVTQIAARDVDRSEHTLGTPSENIRTGTKYLTMCLKEQNGNKVRALAQYNGGYRAVMAIDNEEPLPEETAQYIVKVLTAQEVDK